MVWREVIWGRGLEGRVLHEDTESFEALGWRCVTLECMLW